MKTLIPLVNSPSSSPEISPDFRGVQSVVLFDGVAQSSELLDLEPLRTVPGGLRAWMLEHDIDSVVVGALFPLAQRAFEEVGIACFQAVGSSLAENLAFFATNALVRVEVKGKADCASSCSTCATSCEPAASEFAPAPEVSFA